MNTEEGKVLSFLWKGCHELSCKAPEVAWAMADEMRSHVAAAKLFMSEDLESSFCSHCGALTEPGRTAQTRTVTMAKLPRKVACRVNREVAEEDEEEAAKLQQKPTKAATATATKKGKPRNATVVRCAVCGEKTVLRGIRNRGRKEEKPKRERASDTRKMQRERLRGESDGKHRKMDDRVMSLTEAVRREEIESFLTARGHGPAKQQQQQQQQQTTAKGKQQQKQQPPKARSMLSLFLKEVTQ